jgi:hypothetical protein
MWLRTVLLTVLAAVAAGAPAASAEPRQHAAQQNLIPIRDRGEQRVLTVREIEARLSARFHGGHIVRAQRVDGDSPYYLITWAMPNGEDYRELTVDAVTGQIR